MRNDTASRRRTARRTIAVAAVLALAASMIVLGAPPAQAATLTCDALPYDTTSVSGNFPGTFDNRTSTFEASIAPGGGGVCLEDGQSRTFLGGTMSGSVEGSCYSATISGTATITTQTTTHSFSYTAFLTTTGPSISMFGPAYLTDPGDTLIGIGRVTIFTTTVSDPGSPVCGRVTDMTVFLGAIIPDEGEPLPDLGWVPIPDDLEVIREVASGFNSDDCDTVYGGQQISDNTTQGLHSKLYVRQPTSDSLDVCVRVEQVPSGEGYGGKLSITPTGLVPDVGDPMLPSQDANSTACTNTTPNLVPGSHPITAGGLGGVDYMIDAYASSSEAWLCLYVESTPPTNIRVKVPLGNTVPPVTYGYAATWYPDPETP